MRYLGSKARIKKEIIPIITEHLNGDNQFVDAFIGGANIIDAVDYPKKVGIEYSRYVCAIWQTIKAIGIKWIPSDFKKKEGYKSSIELSTEYNLYRQNFCGCVFSKQEG